MVNVASGQLSLTDLNDAKQLLLYLNPNYKSQVYDPNGGAYNPDFTSTNLVLTPQLFVAGNGTNLIPSAQIKSVTWYEGSQTSSALADTTAGTTPAGLSYAIPAGAANAVAKTLTIKTNLPSNTAVYTCVVIYTDPSTNLDVTCQALIEVQKITNGSAGASSLTVVLTNDNVTIPTDKNGNSGIYTNSGTDIHLYEGATELTYDGTGTANGTWKVVATATGVTAGAVTDAGLYATLASASAITTDSATISLAITGKRANGTAISITQTQTLTRVKAGQDPTAYWLVTDTGGIKMNAAGAYSPATVNVTGKSQIGAGTPGNYSGRFIIEESTDGSTYTPKYTSAADEATKAYAISATANLKAIRVSLYLAGGTTNLLDQQIIPFIYDGTQPITVALTNSAATVPTDEAGNNGIYTATSTDIHVYDGTTELTYDGVGTANGTWKATTAVSGITAGAVSSKTGTPNFGTMAVASAITADAATITFTITGKSSLGVAFTKTSIMAISRAKTGVAPTAYWLVADAVTIQKNYAGAYTPGTINLTAKSQKGSATPGNYSGRFTVEEDTGSGYTSKYTSAADEATHAYAVATASIKSIRVSLYAAGGTTTLLDQQIINVVADGIDSYLLRVSAPNGATIRNGGSDVGLQADMFKGAGAVTPTAFKWYVQDPAATTGSGGDVDGGNGWRLINTVAVPAAAPTIAATTGGSLAAVAHYVKYTWCGLSGETTGSAEATVTPAASGAINVTIPAFVTNATKAKIYVGTATGVEYYAGDFTTAAGGTFKITALGDQTLPIPTTNTATAVTSATLTVKAWAINGVEGFKCVATAPITGGKYGDLIICTDFTDPIVVTIQGQSVFKNGQGSVTLQAQLLQAGTQISTAGYTFAWSLYDNTGTLIKTYPAVTGDTITVPATDVTGSANLVCDVSK